MAFIWKGFLTQESLFCFVTPPYIQGLCSGLFLIVRLLNILGLASFRMKLTNFVGYF